MELLFQSLSFPYSPLPPPHFPQASMTGRSFALSSKAWDGNDFFLMSPIYVVSIVLYYMQDKFINYTVLYSKRYGSVSPYFRGSARVRHFSAGSFVYQENFRLQITKIMKPWSHFQRVTEVSFKDYFYLSLIALFYLDHQSKANMFSNMHVAEISDETFENSD